MLTRFEVKGFKSLVDVAIDLGAVNVFIGANGSGKSNLLEALGFISAATSGKVDQETFRYRGLRLNNSSTYCSKIEYAHKSTIDFIFNDEQTSYQLGAEPEDPRGWIFVREVVEFDGKVVLESSKKMAKLLVGDEFITMRSGSYYPSMTVAPFARLYFAFNKNKSQSDQDDPDILWLNAEFFSDLTNYAIFAPATPHLRGSVGDIQREPVGLGGSGLDRAVESMTAPDPTKFGPFEMDDVLDLIEWAENIGTVRKQNGAEEPARLEIIDRFMSGTRKTISASEASEGALYVLFLLALVGHERSPKMFGVDNFDQALHPRLARELTRMICDQIIADGTRQMFATTHNPLVLDGLNLLDDRIRLFAVDRDASGATQVKRVTVTPELMAQADAGMSLSRLWTMGRLGGVPHNF